MHSALFSTGENNASLAPCALGGYRLATSVCLHTTVIGRLSVSMNYRKRLFGIRGGNYRKRSLLLRERAQAVVRSTRRELPQTAVRGL